jgi:ATP-dependent Clp protease ATP-binding subunit ClpX
MEDILLDTMFELPGADGVEEVVVNEESVTSDVQPLMIYAERKKDEASASAG